MKQVYDLSQMQWTLEGYTPFIWTFEKLFNLGDQPRSVDVPAIPAQVPGSVQNALRRADLLPDWNLDFNSRQCEWVENRHWLYRTPLPDDWVKPGLSYRLECLGLDYSGWVYLNNHEVASFTGTHLPHQFDLTPYLKDSGNLLEIIFDLPPRWLGQFGFTSQMKEWKPRFNYTWDWTPRLVQIGIWDAINLVSHQGSEIQEIRCSTDTDPETGAGSLAVIGNTSAAKDDSLAFSLAGASGVVHDMEYPAAELERGIQWRDLAVDLWWPNLEGEQPLYTLTCRLLDRDGNEQDRRELRLGFKHVEWVACEGAPADADPWICVVNGRPVFLQGVNFAPLRSNFADCARYDYAKLLLTYKELGCNTFRINACQFLEKEWFYDICDEMGLMVWQEFPLTSSGAIDNWPPEEETSIAEMAEIARSFVSRRMQHVSLLLWSGGNELQGDYEGHKNGVGKPCDLNHPMLRRLQEVVKELDPGHRYIPTSPSGPHALAEKADMGKGLHWDVHGPNAALGSQEEAEQYWACDDALFRSEVYCSGASPVDIIQKYAAEAQVFPPTAENTYWTHPTAWWLDWDRLVAGHGREPKDLQEYIEWSQEFQSRRLSLSLKTCKERFPGCGGWLLWSGHDTFPMPINSSIIDYEGRPKPAAKALAQIWRQKAGKQP